MNVRSVLDLGCGKGISTKWFLDHGADVLCVEGSSDAVKQSLLPRDKIVQHDVYEGPWWPEKTYDMLWCVEFLEHIGRHKFKNFLPMFQKAGIIFVTASQWGGWHHVEVHGQNNNVFTGGKGGKSTTALGSDEWWIERFRAYGFVYAHKTTDRLRQIAGLSMNDGYGAQHLRINSMVFYNPAVMKLPEHHHLIGGPGCYKGRNGQDYGGVWCAGDIHFNNGITDFDKLPPRFTPVYTEKTPWDEESLRIWHQKEK